MMKCAVFLADGFEECEGLIPVDLLRRAGFEVNTVSMASGLNVCGSRGVTVLADTMWEDISPEAYDILILPGGKRGKENLEASAELTQAVAEHYKKGKLTCALCASPSILGHLGILKGKRYTCFPDFNEPEFGGCYDTVHAAVRDGNLITGKGMGASIEFAREIIRAAAPERLEQVEQGIQYFPIR